MLRNRKGFTLIELLIVVVIIGILAAIAIPKFAATKDKAKLASVKADLKNMITTEEAFFSDSNYYTTDAAKFSVSSGNTFSGAITASATGFKATIQNASISSGTNNCSVYVGSEATTANVQDGTIKCP